MPLIFIIHAIFIIHNYIDFFIICAILGILQNDASSILKNNKREICFNIV